MVSIILGDALYWEILGDHYLLQGGGDSRGMKWFSRGYKGGVIRNKSRMVSQSITPFLYERCRFFTFNRKHLFLQM